MKKIILFISIVTVFASCKLGKIMDAIDTIENKEVKVTSINRYDGKKIKLVPMSHIGQKEFYASLKDSIIQWKDDGYRMYYEEMSKEASVERYGQEVTDTNVKKWRRIQGGDLGRREEFENLVKDFDNAIIQPEWVEMAIDENDLNADIDITTLVREYEKLYGEIILTECDHNTEIEEEYTCSEKYKNSIKPIIHGVRNQTVVDFINNEGDNKIVVLYGKLHMKELERMIRKRK